jgi:hypothetical protein
LTKNAIRSFIHPGTHPLIEEISMSQATGVLDLEFHACERARRPADIQTNTLRMLRTLQKGERLILGVTEVSGRWKEELIIFLQPGNELYFLNWFTTKRYEIRGDDFHGLHPEPVYVLMKVGADFNVCDYRHEQDSEPEFKEFFRILKETQYVRHED